MKTRSIVLIVSILILSCVGALAADKLVVTVTHDLRGIARPAEVISVPWAEVTKAIPNALLQHLAIKNASGQVLPYQVTNTNALDASGSYGELWFQHDFASGEYSATFTIENTGQVAPPFPSKVFARYVPERLDDFAWENDKIGHRTYGPALAAPRPPGSDKEVLVASGIDVWCKRVNYLIVDRWYNKGHNHYHKDQGEGMDMYQVGPTRGCGGTGIWDGQKLHTSQNYNTWKVLANGPIRAIFELTYGPWEANGVKVTEVKRFTVDAGHNLDQIEATYTFDGDPSNLNVAVGLNKNTGDRGQESQAQVEKNRQGWLAQWEVQKTNGSIGTAVVLAGESADFAEDERNNLILSRVAAGRPVRYYAGAGWSRAGEFQTKEDWLNYVSAFAARVKSPVKVSFSTK